ncbi:MULTISPECIES: hypothetical protein [Paenibacillus]|uniref:hypothetical protein n=1 Tax=Paenibacillus TaxID=44249 RepID=UPI0027960EF5|nr:MULTISPECIES: hypothetical protein [Paenibacillus]
MALPYVFACVYLVLHLCLLADAWLVNGISEVQRGEGDYGKRMGRFEVFQAISGGSSLLPADQKYAAAQYLQSDIRFSGANYSGPLL